MPRPDLRPADAPQGQSSEQPPKGYFWACFLDGHYLCINGLVDADSLKTRGGVGKGKEG